MDGRRSFRRHATRIAYKLIEGDLDRFDGTWRFDATALGKTRVHLSVDFDFGVPTLAELIGPTLERKVRENADMMLAALKRQAEKNASGLSARERGFEEAR